MLAKGSHKPERKENYCSWPTGAVFDPALSGAGDEGDLSLCLFALDRLGSLDWCCWLDDLGSLDCWGFFLDGLGFTPLSWPAGAVLDPSLGGARDELDLSLGWSLLGALLELGSDLGTSSDEVIPHIGSGLILSVQGLHLGLGVTAQSLCRIVGLTKVVKLVTNPTDDDIWLIMSIARAK